MLILTRRIDEAVRIGGDVTVKILGVRGTHVRIGITAPKVIPIKREELVQADPGLDDESQAS